jgi:hypothetical protein
MSQTNESDFHRAAPVAGMLCVDALPFQRYGGG